MKNVIQLLPEVVSNQIAAGEVVQRPASVVKELLENSIDAGSTEITLNVVNSGKTLIQVIDNGMGMSELDSRLCFEKYATSKIRETEDLFNLKTMGFRGEAMASIGAVAQVTLRTNNETDLLGTQIVVEGSKVISQTPINIMKGTNIAVKNLFFNVPARRSFLKSDQVEFKHILDEFIRIALSNSDVHFKVMHNDREIYNLPSAKLSNRIVSLFKSSYRNQMIFCSDETSDIKIKGYVGKPEFAKKHRGEQFIFVNGRYIKSPLLHSSIMKAYDNIIKPGYLPFYVLFFEVDPSKIDVNIHPTKSEIKFEDERMIYSILNSTIRKSISTVQLVNSLDFESDINSPTNRVLEAVGTRINNTKRSYKDNNYANFKNYDKSYYDNNQLSNFYKEMNQLSEQEENIQTEIVTLESKINEKPTHEQFVTTSPKIFYADKYIFTTLGNEVIVVDVHAARERVVYEKLIRTLETSSNSSQQLLFPEEITLSNDELELLKVRAQALKELGVEFKFSDNSSILISALPSSFIELDINIIIDEILVSMKEGNDELSSSIEVNHKLASMISKRVVSTQKTYREEELEALLGSLFASSNCNYTSTGRKIIYQMDEQEVSSYFDDTVKALS